MSHVLDKTTNRDIAAPTPTAIDPQFTVGPGTVLGYRTPLEQHPLSADGKATTLLTLVGLMFTILGRFSPILSKQIQNPGWERPIALLLLFLFAAAAFGVVAQSFRTILPRFPKAPPSLAFFGDIARLSRDEYIQRVEGLSSREALEQMLSYNHTSSLISVEKFKQLKLAVRIFQATLIAWGALLALIAWGGLG